MMRYWLLCLYLAACSQYEDGKFLAIDALPPPVSVTLGIPLRVTVAGGNGVRLDVMQGTLGDELTSGCLTIAGSNSAIVVVHPNDTEAVVVGQLYKTCSDTSTVLAETETQVHLQAANPPGDAGADSTATDANTTVDAAGGTP
jgi:hypothetical protein